MILLDTNVVAEPMRRRPDPRVQDWLDSQAIETLYLSTISLSELLSGMESLPAGRRRRALAAALGEQIVCLFDDRLVPFDVAAAEAYAKVMARARSRGHPISATVGQIAAIAASRKFKVASREGTSYRAAGLEVINPWMSE